jgi:hypothetical protein
VATRVKPRGKPIQPQVHADERFVLTLRLFAFIGGSEFFAASDDLRPIERAMLCRRWLWPSRAA